MKIGYHTYIVAACFLSTLIAYFERTGFSIAYTAVAKESGTPEGTKGKVLSSFYWGYGISQVPGGLAAQTFGGELTLSLSFFFWSTASILTPTSGSNLSGIMAARFCVGVAQGLLIPAVHTVLSKWIPPTERAKAVSLTTSGMYLGSATAMLILPTVVSRMGAGALLRSVGILGLSWLFFWKFCLLQGNKARSLQIMPIHNEKASISNEKDSLGANKTSRHNATPWRSIILHPAVWAIIINNYSFHYAFYVVMNWLPTYFDRLLGTNLALLGPMKTLPYIAMFVTSNVGGWMGDWLIHTRHRSVAGGRKSVNTLGFFAASIALALMPYCKSIVSGILCITFALGACGFARGGFSVNHMDIAPKYAGVVMLVIINIVPLLASVSYLLITLWLPSHFISFLVSNDEV